MAQLTVIQNDLIRKWININNSDYNDYEKGLMEPLAKKLAVLIIDNNTNGFGQIWEILKRLFGWKSVCVGNSKDYERFFIFPGVNDKRLDYISNGKIHSSKPRLFVSQNSIDFLKSHNVCLLDEITSSKENETNRRNLIHFLRENGPKPPVPANIKSAPIVSNETVIDKFSYFLVEPNNNSSSSNSPSELEEVICYYFYEFYYIYNRKWNETLFIFINIF